MDRPPEDLEVLPGTGFTGDMCQSCQTEFFPRQACELCPLEKDRTMQTYALPFSVELL